MRFRQCRANNEKRGDSKSPAESSVSYYEFGHGLFHNGILRIVVLSLPNVLSGTNRAGAERAVRSTFRESAVRRL